MTAAMSRRVATREEAHQAARDAYATAWQIIANGGECTVRVVESEEDISTKQRGFFHAAVLPQIAEQVVVDGTRYVAAVWKHHLRSLYLPDTWESRHALVVDKATGTLRKAKRATPHRVRKSTEELGVKSYSRFIDECIAHAAAEWGVQFIFRAEEREGARYVAPVRKAKQQQQEEATA